MLRRNLHSVMGAPSPETFGSLSPECNQIASAAKRHKENQFANIFESEQALVLDASAYSLSDSHKKVFFVLNLHFSQYWIIFPKLLTTILRSPCRRLAYSPLVVLISLILK